LVSLEIGEGHHGLLVEGEGEDAGACHNGGMAGIVQNEATPERDPALALIAIASSAGSLKPMLRIATDLPRHFPGAVVIAQHVASQTILPDLLRGVSQLEVVTAESGMLLRPGTIYVCPGKRHITIAPDARIWLSERDRLDHVRPSGDWLFESAAAS